MKEMLWIIADYTHSNFAAYLAGHFSAAGAFSVIFVGMAALTLVTLLCAGLISRFRQHMG